MRLVAAAVLLALSGSGLAAEERGAAPVVAAAVQRDISPPLRDLVARRGPVVPGPDREIGNRFDVQLPRPAGQDLARDPLLDASSESIAPSAPTPAPSLSFEGTTDDDNAAVAGFRVVPPDTNGDVGLDHYVQENNLVLEIFDKATGASILGPAAGNAPWIGFGGICETDNDGDPTVLYDHMADRWVFSQFANPPGQNNGHQCFAVSTTPDPTGPYHRYAFVVSPGHFNDYPKVGVWPDAYYISVNEFGATSGFRGAVAVAVERASMLAGLPAQMVRFAVPGFEFGLQPSHLEGPGPEPGTPNTFVSQVNSLVDGYRLWEFSVDWSNPAASTFAQLPFVASSSFDPSVSLVPQAAPGESLDALGGNFLMYRAQAREFATHRSLTLTHTVDAGANRAGMRWAELRNWGGGWVLHQEGTHAPADGLHRWMGSVAQDRNGNIALGYSVSSSTMMPAIRYTSRTATDPLGTLPGGEVTLHAGTGVQTSSFNRWGDYSAMSTDPFPDCTFWYTQEYYANTNSFDFKTRVGSFTFPNCGPSLLLRVNGDAADVVRATPTSLKLTLAGADGDSVKPMDWYYALIIEGSVVWVTTGGLTMTPTPLVEGVPPADFSDVVLWDYPLPSGTQIAFLFFFLDGATVPAWDLVTAVVP